MAVLTDFGAYPRIFPILEAVEVSRASAREWEVRFTLFYLRRLRYALLIQRPEPGRLLWSLIEGDLKAAEGSWQVEPRPGGQVEVELRLDVQTTMRLPGPFLRSLEEVELPRVLMGLRAELERRAALAVTASNGAEALAEEAVHPVVDRLGLLDEGGVGGVGELEELRPGDEAGDLPRAPHRREEVALRGDDQHGHADPGQDVPGVVRVGGEHGGEEEAQIEGGEVGGVGREVLLAGVVPIDPVEGGGGREGEG
jgi:ribosome-associated toxin RatA of RatAB toxin-antitoxin module